MKKLLFGTLLFALAAMVIVSCKKNDDDDTTPTSNASKTDLLTAHAWIMTDMKFDPPLPFPFDTINAFNFIPACEKDDFITFKSDGTGTSDDGPSKCEPTDPQTEPFDWEWRKNETELYVTDSDTTLVTNVKVSASSMSGLIEDDSPLGSGKVTLKVTFSKK